ncbi:MAG: DMT family transporter [Kofleriaceae bacterium]|nr:DMT family transporter [Kofleriaceae bacterium]
MVGFAANSLLCRGALGAASIDAASFTAVRVASGALALAALVPRAARRAGSWAGAAALAAYALAFSFAYLRLAAGVGALLLFGAVQVTMMIAGLRAGERPGPWQWLGLAAAFGGLVVLVAPALAAPDPVGAALMAIAGVAWGVYSLIGRGAAHPLAATADNFARATPVALAVAAATIAWGRLGGGGGHVEVRGVALAATSGVAASGLGYTLWYAALRGLSRTQAAIAQLTVPVIAAAGAVALLDEVVTPRLVIAAVAIAAGVVAALAAPSRR